MHRGTNTSQTLKLNERFPYRSFGACAAAGRSQRWLETPLSPAVVGRRRCGSSIGAKQGQVRLVDVGSPVSHLCQQLANEVCRLLSLSANVNLYSVCRLSSNSRSLLITRTSIICVWRLQAAASTTQVTKPWYQQYFATSKHGSDDGQTWNHFQALISYCQIRS